MIDIIGIIAEAIALMIVYSLLSRFQHTLMFSYLSNQLKDIDKLLGYSFMISLTICKCVGYIYFYFYHCMHINISVLSYIISKTSLYVSGLLTSIIVITAIIIGAITLILYSLTSVYIYWTYWCKFQHTLVFLHTSNTLKDMVELLKCLFMIISVIFWCIGYICFYHYQYMHAIVLLYKISFCYNSFCTINWCNFQHTLMCSYQINALKDIDI